MEYPRIYQRTIEAATNLNNNGKEIYRSFRRSLGLAALIAVVGCYVGREGGQDVPDDIPSENRKRWLELRNQEKEIMRQQDAGKELTADEDRRFQDLSRERGDLED